MKPEYDDSTNFLPRIIVQTALPISSDNMNSWTDKFEFTGRWRVFTMYRNDNPNTPKIKLEFEIQYDKYQLKWVRSFCTWCKYILWVKKEYKKIGTIIEWRSDSKFRVHEDWGINQCAQKTNK